MCECENSIPILTPQFDLSFDIEDDDVTDEQRENGGCSERTANNINEVKSLRHHVKNGALILNVSDDEEFSERSFLRVITLRTSQGESSQHHIVKYQPGPLQSYHNTDEESAKYCFLTTESQVVLIEEYYNEDEDVLQFLIFYVNLVDGKWLEHSFRIPSSENLGTHTFCLDSSQLLIYFNRPVKIFAFDFPRKSMTSYSNDVTVRRWESDLNAYRILSCFNFVMLFTNQKPFVCLTFTQETGVIETRVKRPDSLLQKEYDELVQVVNIRGKIVLIAKKDSAVLFLTIQENSFEITKKIDFKGMECFKTSNPMIVKNMICWKQSRLFIPLACMKRTFPQDDQVLSQTISIADIEMRTLKVISISQINSKVNIYQEVFSCTVLQHGGSVYVQKERKCSNGNGSRVVTGHVINLYPQTLKQAAILKIVNNSSNKTLSTRFSFSRHLHEQIIQCYDF